MPKRKDKSKSKSKYRIKSKNNKNKNTINIKIIGGQGGGGGGSSYIPHPPHHQNIDYDRIRDILHQASPRSSLIPNTIKTNNQANQTINTSSNESNDDNKSKTSTDKTNIEDLYQMSDNIPTTGNPIFMMSTKTSDIQNPPITNLNVSDDQRKNELDEQRKKVYEDKQDDLNQINNKIKQENKNYNTYNDLFTRLKNLKDNEKLEKTDELRKEINTLLRYFDQHIGASKTKESLLNSLSKIQPDIDKIHQMRLNEIEERKKEIENTKIGARTNTPHTLASYNRI